MGYAYINGKPKGGGHDPTGGIMKTRELAEAFHNTELGALVMEKANDAVIGLVNSGVIENTEEAKNRAYGESLKMLMELFVIPNVGK